ncbi:MAG: VWA domain-containing protein [Kineosporiaceae bacterium]
MGGDPLTTTAGAASPPPSGPPGPGVCAATVLGGVDRAAFAVALVERLRAAGADAGTAGVDALARALDLAPPATRGRLYWACRVTLVHRHADLDAFDRVFDTAFGAVLGVDPHARRSGVDGGSAPSPPGAWAPAGVARSAAPTRGGGAPWLRAPAVVEVSAAPDPDPGADVPDLLPAALAGDADTPFPELSPALLADLGQALSTALAAWPRRRTRRFAATPAGHRVALRETLARSRRTGWEPVEVVGLDPVRRPRRLVVVCDVSRSMRGYAEAYLHLMRAATTVTGAEAFAFATRLTRLTPALRASTPEAAVAHASAEVADRFGGTRIATALGELVRSHHGGALRGAVVVVASDGWDSDDPEALAVVMARIRRRAHRVLWLNPRAAAQAYRPLAGGMAAALPYCDDLLPAHTPRAMLDVVAAIAGPRRIRGDRLTDV